ncbi:MAG: hypothetical protein LBV43_15600 [Prevotella sp.]|jgi:hypothetical protein|nr:hypothetical protein [Prevotella sp.]
MCKTFILLVTFFFYCVLLTAQDSGQKINRDTLYLKNGKTIKGVVIKQDLGVISIDVTDSISRIKKTQHYQRTDIRKIALGKNHPKAIDGQLEGGKKLPLTPQNVGQANTPVTDTPFDLLPEKSPQPISMQPVTVPDTKAINQPLSLPVSPVSEGEMLAAPMDPSELAKAPKTRRKHRGWYRQIKGYRGFIEYGYVVGVGPTKNNKMEFLTSHGFQFNPIFYVGAGTGGYLSMNDKDHSLPVFINGRMNLLDEFTTPFIDIKTGYSVAEGKGFYFNASAGVSFSKKGGFAINLSATYCAQNVKYYEWQNTSPITRVAIRERQRGFGLRLGIEF